MTTVGIQVRDSIFNHQFFLNFFMVTLPFIILILITIAFHCWTAPNNEAFAVKSNQRNDGELIMSKNIKPLLTAGFVLGIGIGSFFDGIFFHQLLQIHNMVSNVLFPDTLVKAEINMFWDGCFHAFAWTMTLLGIILLWNVIKNNNVPKLTNVLIGSIFIGFGTFNLIEGIIDHHILKLHHVVERSIYPYQFYYDLAFLFSGIILIGFGYCVMKSNKVSCALS
jgi:uncharacterized membrane protein